jgi:hypothetical protein
VPRGLKSPLRGESDTIGGRKPPAPVALSPVPFLHNPPPSGAVQCRVLDGYLATCQNTATQYIPVDMAPRAMWPGSTGPVTAVVPACDDCITRIDHARKGQIK